MLDTSRETFRYLLDVTPSRLITGLITDRGIIRPPFRNTIRQLLTR